MSPKVQKYKVTDEPDEEWVPLHETSTIEPPASPTQEEAQPPVPDIVVVEENAPVASPVPRVTASSTPKPAAVVSLQPKRRRYQDQLSFLDDLLDDQEDNRSIHKKLDNILENQKVLFKLIAELMGERKSVSEGLSSAGRVGGKYVFQENSGRKGGAEHVVLGDLSNVVGGTNESLMENMETEGSQPGILGDISNVLGGSSVTGSQPGTLRDISNVLGETSAMGGQPGALRDISNVFGGTSATGGQQGVLRDISFAGGTIGTSMGNREHYYVSREQSFGEEGEQFMGEALAIKRTSCSVGNFAAKFLSVVFKPEELVNRNCAGTREKGALDAVKVNVVRKYALKMYPSSPAMEEGVWRKCVIAIDEFLRRKKGGKQRQE